MNKDEYNENSQIDSVVSRSEYESAAQYEPVHAEILEAVQQRYVMIKREYETERLKRHIEWA